MCVLCTGPLFETVFTLHYLYPIHQASRLYVPGLLPSPIVMHESVTSQC